MRRIGGSEWLTGRRLYASLLHISVAVVVVMVVKVSVINFVDTMRPASYWSRGYVVDPVMYKIPLGQMPEFRTKAYRPYEVGQSWDDLMYCRATSGNLAGKLRFIGASYDSGKIFKAPPAYIGYDKPPKGGYKQGIKRLDGYWTWNGPLPKRPSICFLQPQPYVHPSLGVTPKLVAVKPTAFFEFYVPDP